MNTTVKEQIEAIQVAINSLQKINDGVFLLSVNHELVAKILPALNDAGSSLAALNLSDPYKEIERLKSELLERDASWLPAKDAEIEMLEADIRSYRNGHEINAKRYVEALQKIAELEKALAHYADVNQNQ